MTAMDVTLGQLARWLPHASLVGDPDRRIARVHTDSRSLQAGDLFVALKGPRFDAADYLPDAAAAGAAAALCARAAAGRLQASGLPGLVVPDPRWALGALARRWRRRHTGPLVAVTGSNGKTTVTQMVGAIFRAWQGDAALVTQGNFNNDIGLPLTLLRLRPQHGAAVVELGMNHPGEIAALAGIAAPTVALVNNAQREHQEFMASVEAVARENGSVFLTLPAEGTAVFPADDAHAALWQSLSSHCRQLAFGTRRGRASVFVDEAAWAGDRWRLRAVVADAGALTLDLHAAGQHNLHNAAAALACAHAAGAPAAAMAQGLAQFRPLPGRGQIRRIHDGARTIKLVDDTYNANPDSVRALIDLLATLPGPQLLVLGDMGEVGEQGVAWHAEVGAYARERGISRLLATGQLAIHAAMAFGGSHFEQINDLIAAVRTNLTHCASIAVKGSRFMHMERIVAALAPTEADEPGGDRRAA
ncbi:MAG: UDP-N-acetylmuramoyl-tripeptide--D-alanyl-D-alanine ligase [Ottowia sp.]|nr:UDP-N-acetylmuramoyl-tripeptide--D-alanyl-D-alanine ligase [Ottowia sp.]